MYKCPRCTADLKTIRYEGTEIETCPVCEGEWLDADELAQIIQRVEHTFSREEMGTLDRARQRVFRVTHGGQERLNCPKCPDQKLTPFNYASTSGIILDKCPTCGGIWLDRGELEMVQALVEEWSGYVRRDEQRPDIANRVDEEEAKRTPSGKVKSRIGFVAAVLRWFS